MDRITTDVLIVGGGLAGLRAAIAAAEAGLRVLLASKTEVAVDNCTAVVWGAASGAVGETSEQDYLQTLQDKSDGLADPYLQRILAYESGAALEELERFGVQYDVRKGHIMLRGAGLRRGEALTRPLAEFAAAKGAELRSGVCVNELLVADGQCCGATALDLNTGDTLAVHAKATILCGGGHAGIFPRHDNPGRTTGDCTAMAIRAGAPVRDMEFVQFQALGLAEGIPPHDAMNFGPAIAAGQLQLADGTPVTKADLSDVWAERAQDLNRNDERFDAFLDLTHADWRDERLGQIRCQLLGGIPVDERPVRVSPLAHYTTGGIAIDQHGATGIECLFAAGECTGGVFGAARPGGAALTDCVVFGRRAGYEAARQAKERGELPQVEVSPIEFDGNDDATSLVEEAKAVLHNYAFVAVTPPGLHRCHDELARLEQESGGLRPGTPADWLVVHELRSVLCVGQQIVGAASSRDATDS